MPEKFKRQLQNFFLERQQTNFVKVRMKKKTKIFTTIELNVEESDRMPLFPATQN